MASEYDSYVSAEWEMFVGDGERGRASLEAVAGLEVRRELRDSNPMTPLP